MFCTYQVVSSCFEEAVFGIDTLSFKHVNS